MRLLFGECVIDTDLHLLTRAGRTIRLSPKAFALLAVLAERRPRVVPRAELRRLLWPDTQAGGTTLARLVNEVRGATSDDAARGLVVRTVPRVGYAFVAAATDEGSRAAASRCAVQWGQRYVPLVEGENVIGRAADATISIASRRISRRHARIVVEPGRATLEDMGSKNGTFVGGRLLEGPVELQPGDQIGVGPILLIFHRASAEDSTSTGLSP